MVFHFPSITKPKEINDSDWSNWKWQLKSCLNTKADYEKFFYLNTSQKSGFNKLNFSVKTTPYYAQLASMSKTDAIKKIIVPDVKEQEEGVQSMKDPLGEVAHSPVSHIVHRYPDRVLFLVVDFCPIYCRYCTRKRFTAQRQKVISSKEYKKALAYIASNGGIREVILSGGDPFVLSDSILENILKDIRAIKHIEIIRIGSRMPAVCPMRFSTKLINSIKKYQPVFVMSHFNHPEEVTQQSAEILNLLADNGIPVFNQMVLINGVNNHPAVVQALCRRLLFLRVRPYYMFQCDPSLGTDHLRTSTDNSQWIQKQLWGVLSGLATPRLAMDIPGGGGKVEITPIDIKTTNSQCVVTGWDGVTGVYKNPNSQTINTPKNIDMYLKEWNTLQKQPYGNVTKKDYVHSSSKAQV